jgi:uncharacterized protein
MKGSGDLARLVVQCATARGVRAPTNTLPVIQTTWVRQSQGTLDIILVDGDHFAEVQGLLERAYGAPDTTLCSDRARTSKQCMENHSTKPDRTWDVLWHVSAAAGFMIPLGNIIGPLIVWLVKKHEMPSVDLHGKESLNFQISVFLYALVSAILIFVLVGFILLPIVVIGAIVLVVIAAIKAGNGEFYRYPFTIRFIK